MNRIAIRSRALGLLALGALPVLAFAQADPFDTAMGTITASVTDYGGALVGLSAVAVVFFVAIKYVKKISKAA